MDIGWVRWIVVERVYLALIRFFECEADGVQLAGEWHSLSYAPRHLSHFPDLECYTVRIRQRLILRLYNVILRALVLHSHA